MSVSSKYLRRITAWGGVVVFGLTFLMLYPFLYVTLHNPAWHPWANKIRLFWAKILFPLTASSYELYYDSPLDPNKQYVVCSNHTSMIDIPLSAILLNGANFKFMAKHQLAELPVFGIFFRTVDIPVNRESKIASFRAYKQALEALDNGYSLIIYPEGTTSDIAPQMLEFKNGPFKIAIDKQVPVVPVTFLDNWHMFLYDGSMLFRPGRARVIVHQPIETIGLTQADADNLRDRVYDIIDTDLKNEYGSKFVFSR